MRIIIASTRTPKINGVKKAVQRLSDRQKFDFSSIRFETMNVVSGVSDTPVSAEEIILGARQRSEKAFTADSDETVLSIGVEGGLFIVEKKVLLQSWSCAFNGERFHIGGSGAIELPEELSYEVINRGVELGIAIDAFSQQTDVRSGKGTFGILTNDLISREDSFELSSIFALTPFFNTTLYKKHTALM